MRSTMRNSNVEPSQLDLPDEVKGHPVCPWYCARGTDWAVGLSRCLAGTAARLAELVRARAAGSYGESELNLMDDDRIDD